MKVLLTGATGFVGHRLLHALLAAGHQVACLVRPGSIFKLPVEEEIAVIPGDALDPKSLEGRLQGLDAVIHLIGIIKAYPKKGITFERLHVEAAKHIIDAATAQGVKRFLHMSALGARPNAVSLYHRTKYQAEDYLKKSGLDWTIFRPSVIYGPGDKSVNLFARMIKYAPIVPVLGEGKNKLQPVSLDEVVAGFLKALSDPQAIGKTFEIGGPEAYEMTELLDQIAEAMGKKPRRQVHIPLPWVEAQTRYLEPLPFYPLSHDQLVMLQEDNVCDPQEYFRFIGSQPKSLKDGLKYLRTT